MNVHSDPGKPLEKNESCVLFLQDMSVFVIPKTRAGIEKYEPYKLIKERLNDKATLEDIFAVVERKKKEWFGTKV